MRSTAAHQPSGAEYKEETPSMQWLRCCCCRCRYVFAATYVSIYRHPFPAVASLRVSFCQFFRGSLSVLSPLCVSFMLSFAAFLSFVVSSLSLPICLLFLLHFAVAAAVAAAHRCNKGPSKGGSGDFKDPKGIGRSPEVRLDQFYKVILMLLLVLLLLLLLVAVDGDRASVSSLLFFVILSSQGFLASVSLSLLFVGLMPLLLLLLLLLLEGSSVVYGPSWRRFSSVSSFNFNNKQRCPSPSIKGSTSTPGGPPRGPPGALSGALRCLYSCHFKLRGGICHAGSGDRCSSSSRCCCCCCCCTSKGCNSSVINKTPF